jgi:hypothetical protein
VFLDLDEGAIRRRRGACCVSLLRVDGDLPDLHERIFRVALLEVDLDRNGGSRKAERLGESLLFLLRLGRGFPFAVDRGEAARVKDALRRRVDHLEKVLAEVRVVEHAARVSGPGQRFQNHPVHAEMLFRRRARVKVIDAHRPRRGSARPHQVDGQRGCGRHHHHRTLQCFLGDLHWRYATSTTERPSSIVPSVRFWALTTDEVLGLARMYSDDQEEPSMPELVAAVRVTDAGTLDRGFNIAEVARTGDDSNFSVRVTLGATPPLNRLYPQASLCDARVGFTVDMTETAAGVAIDVAVEADHTSGFFLTVFSAP